MLEEDLQTNTTQVPFIGSLPYVGQLFRTKTDSIVRREILVLVTPRIVYSPEYESESVDGQQDFERRQTVARDGQTLLSRSHSARRFIRRSREAIERGDLITARRYADMAVKFDPSNREAMDLRTELMGAPTLRRPEPLDRKVDRTLRNTMPNTPPAPPADDATAKLLDGENVSPWLLDELQGRPGAGRAMHPKDPGIPGDIRSINVPDTVGDGK